MTSVRRTLLIRFLPENSVPSVSSARLVGKFSSVPSTGRAALAVAVDSLNAVIEVVEVVEWLCLYLTTSLVMISFSSEPP
jgi:hypothetical protein